MENKVFFVDKTLYKGRPEDTSNRLEKEVRVYDLLDSLGIEYERADHDTADTIEDCEEVEKVIGVDICKNLFLCNRQMTKFYVLMMPGKKPFKTKDISQQIGSARLSFAPAEKMLEYLDITPGSVSIMGLANKKMVLIGLPTVKSTFFFFLNMLFSPFCIKKRPLARSKGREDT